MENFDANFATPEDTISKEERLFSNYVEMLVDESGGFDFEDKTSIKEFCSDPETRNKYPIEDIKKYFQTENHNSTSQKLLVDVKAWLSNKRENEK